MRWKVDGQTLRVSRGDDEKQSKAHHGLVRSLIANMLKGVTDGYEIRLEMVGTGYRAALQGQKLVLSVGFSHSIDVMQPAGITFAVEGNNKITIKGISKHDVDRLPQTSARSVLPSHIRAKEFDMKMRLFEEKQERL